MQPSERIVRVLLLLLARPYRYTIKQLAEKFGKSEDRLRNDIEVLKNVGLKVGYEPKHYRYFVIPDSQFKELKYLQPLKEEDKIQIGVALEKYMPSKDATHLKNKLDSLYDFQQLGLQALRQPALEKIERLELSANSQKQVILKNYRSNSNSISDRRLEVFDVSVEFDTVQAFDVDKKSIKHFRLSRIERVQLTDAPQVKRT